MTVTNEAWRPTPVVPASVPRTWREAGVRVVRDPSGWDDDQQGAPAQLSTMDADTAVRALYAAHWTGLVRLAALLLQETATAEEVVQDAFVALHRRWSRLADKDAALGYLRTSVVNGARSALRHRNVAERHRPVGAPEPAGPEERALQSVQDARVMAALRRLPRRQQEVLVLRYYSDLSETEIADSLGVSRGAVKSHAHRGIASLRAALAEEAS